MTTAVVRAPQLLKRKFDQVSENDKDVKSTKDTIDLVDDLVKPELKSVTFIVLDIKNGDESEFFYLEGLSQFQVDALAKLDGKRTEGNYIKFGNDSEIDPEVFYSWLTGDCEDEDDNSEDECDKKHDLEKFISLRGILSNEMNYRQWARFNKEKVVRADRTIVFMNCS